MRAKFPKLAVLMDDAECDVLAFMTFPEAHRVQIHSTNPLERLNAEIKRRTDVVPNEAAKVQGLRRRDPKNGLAISPRLTVRNAWDIVTKPRWAKGVLFGRRRTFGNLEFPRGGSTGLKTLSEWIGKQFDSSASWKDVEWVRSRWPGKIVVKGILHPDDAGAAVDCGVDSLVCSNHGGRQQDSAAASIHILPQIVEAVGRRSEVLFDAGVMNGKDVLKGLGLGARGCLVGKAFLYSLAAMGEGGVSKLIAIIREELRISLALAGKASVASVDKSVLGMM